MIDKKFKKESTLHIQYQSLKTSSHITTIIKTT